MGFVIAPMGIATMVCGFLVPAETVSRALAASSMGLVVGVGELFGGVAAPTIAGAIADSTSLAAPMYVMIVCAATAGVLSLFLVETAPRKEPRHNTSSSRRPPNQKKSVSAS